MTLPLINTKFFVPHLRPSYIVRPRLKETLNHEFMRGNEFARKLSLICAPAGYGKTSLAVDWLSTLAFPLAWLSLDESDTDPVRFLTYLVHAFRQVLPGVGGPTLGMLQSPQLPVPEELLAPLLNEIESAGSPFILIIDDYHLIQSSVIHQYFNFLVEYQPAALHIVITSREDPPWPLHRLRARGQLVEIRQEQIRFTLQETADFIQTIAGKEITWDNIQAIEHRTEGWVTGMQLLALSLHDHPNANEFLRSFTGSDRFVLDYLFEEVFHRQERQVQEFLLKTAVLENLCADLCKAVTGQEDSRDILNTLDQTNLFVSRLDHSLTWFRYHRLFLDLLKHHLRLQTRLEIADLHRKASRWYQENGYLEEAVNHALAGGDWLRGLDLIYQASGQLLKAGAIATILGWYKQIPLDSTLSKPEYALTYAWPLLLSGQLGEAEVFLETAEKLAADNSPLMGEVAAAQAFQAQTMGEEKHMVEYSERALSLLPKTDYSSRGVVAMNLGLAYWHFGEMEKAEKTLTEALTAARQGDNKYAEITAWFFSGRIYAVRGQLRQAGAIFNNILQLKLRMPIIGLVYLDVSMLHYERNELDACEEYLIQGIEMIGDKGHREFQFAALMQKARLLTAKGDQKSALALLEELSQLGNESEIPLRTRTRLASCIVELAIACGKLELARSWLEKASGGSEAHPFYRFLSLATIRMLITQNIPSEASQQLEETVAKATAAGWQYGVICLRALQALTAPDLDSAVGYLAETLELAHTEGFMRTFLDCGNGLVPVLREAARRGLYPAYIGQILATFESQPDQTVLPAGMEPLSERELEVLHLMAAGLSNRQIADQLVVSVSTVKSHVHHISSKLDVGNRTQAVARARELGLL